jgi:FKBP-type peptidyl-prolyl cis-trans isomerase FkpA/FKBP-type peptidyl-prolyl cis-trans isomerase FklB
MKYILNLLLLAFVALTFSGCGKDDLIGIEEYISLNGLTGFTKTPEGVYVKIINEGSQAKPNLGSLVTTHYKGSLTNGKVFDSSYDRNAPATFSLTSVIRGWQIGIPKFGKGGKGTLIIPSNLGYGSAGQGDIPGNAVLIFDIELISFQ